MEIEEKIEEVVNARRVLLYLECEELTDKQADILSDAIDLLYDLTDSFKEEQRTAEIKKLQDSEVK